MASSVVKQRTIELRVGLARYAGLAGIPLLTVVFGLAILTALLPAAIAVTTGFLLDTLTVMSPGGGGELAASMGSLAGCLFLSVAATLTLDPVLRLAELRIDGRLRQEVMRRVGGLRSLDRLEDEKLQDDLAHFSTGAIYWMDSSVGAGALAQVQQLIAYAGLIPAALLLSQYTWWWGPAMVVLCVVVREANNRGTLSFERVLTHTKPTSAAHIAGGNCWQDRATPRRSGFSACQTGCSPATTTRWRVIPVLFTRHACGYCAVS